MIIIRLHPGAARARRENINLECIYKLWVCMILGVGACLNRWAPQLSPGRFETTK